MNQYFGHPVVNWANQHLQPPVEIKLKGNSIGYKILLGFCFAFLALVFLGIPLLFYISAITTFLDKGWNEKVSGALVGGTVFLAVAVMIFLAIFFLLMFTRRKFAKVLSLQGVETRGGQKFSWEKLQFLNYKQVVTQVNGRSFAANVAQAAMLAGVEKVTVEMVFENGKAVVPPLIERQPEILALLNSMPAERRDEGKIRR
jgi:hypothetical protein